MSVSFVVTVYNKRPFLPVVLPAVAAECADVGGEIVIVDDGSTDGSGEVLDRFCATNRACRLIRQSNAGPPAAVTAGLRAATMPHIRLIDADDIPVRGSTRVMVDALERTDAGLIGGEKQSYDLKTLDAAQLRPIDPGAGDKASLIADPLYETIRKNEFVPSVIVMRREIAAAVVPVPDISYTSHDFYIVAQAAGLAPVAKLSAVVCHFAVAAENRMSSSVAGMYHDTVIVSRQYMQGPHTWSRRHRRYALRRCAGRALLYARRHLGFRPGLWLALFLVRLAGYLPLYALYPALLTFVASTYRSQLVRRPSTANLGLAARQDLHNLAAKTKA
jgi:glycosyltransferase involved in cell wall biosynthesis